MTVDYLFGAGVSRALPLDRLEFYFSPRTGRMRRVYLGGKLVCTIRPDGGVALTIYGATLLMESPNFRENCVTVADGVEEFVARGRSVFCKHVIDCGSNIRPASEVVVLDREGRVLAVGKAVLSSRMVKAFKVGVAVKVRKGASE